MAPMPPARNLVRPTPPREESGMSDPRSVLHGPAARPLLGAAPALLLGTARHPR